MKTFIVIFLAVMATATQLNCQSLIWQRINSPADEIYFSIYKAPSGRLYTSTSNGNNQAGFYVSSDEGASWTNLSPSGSYLTKICTNDETNWLASNNFPSLPTNFSIFLSRDGGKTWDSTPLHAYQVALAKNNNIVAADDQQKRLHLSTDFGQTWQPVESVSSMAVTHLETGADGRIWASTAANGVIISDDNGITWRNLSPAPPASNLAMISVSETGRAFIVTDDDKAYYMNESKNRWNSIMLAPPALQANNIYDIFAVRNDCLIIINIEHEYLMSYDSGESWEYDYNDNHVKTVYSFCRDGNTIYAGTHSGVYKSGLEPLSVDESEAPKDLIMLESGKLLINSGAAISIYDMKGNKALELTSSGDSSREIDLSGLSHGVFFIAVDNGSKRIIRKILN